MGEPVSAQEQVIVVVGASAGGIDALEHLTASLPPDFAAPIVVALHLDPTHASRLADILQQHTELPVVSLSGSETLAPATVYVVPPGEDVEIGPARASLSSRKKRGAPVPSIDALFKSAATSYADRSIAVVLSGMGSDGQEGVEAIKQAGGAVVVQDPSTAPYPALPGSIPPVNIDLTCDLETMGPLLCAMISDGELSARKLDDQMLRGFLMQLRARSGIDFTQYKSRTIKRRIARLMAATSSQTLVDYMRYLNTHPDAYQRLVSSLLIKVTGFFRDPALFKELRERVLPSIIDNARRSRSELRFWSAGCATGEEAYSLAILLWELLGEDVEEMEIRIFATDLDSKSIAFARRGIYPATAVSEMPRELLQKYFTKVDDSYQIKKRIRNLTVFGEHDLGKRAPFPRIDLILCRNVLIYFTKELQQRTLRMFALSLREGGYLILGKTEINNPLPELFAAVHPTLKIFRRQGERLLITAPAFTGVRLAEQVPARRVAAPSSVPTHHSSAAPTRWSITERLGAFFFDSAIGVVIVDRNYDILTINQAARHVLAINGQAIGEDLIHLAGGVQSTELKSLLDSALAGTTVPPREQQIGDGAVDQVRYAAVSCYPEKGVSSETGAASAVLLIEDVTSSAFRRRELEKAYAESQVQAQQLRQQNEGLLERQRSLSRANEELTGANSDLRNTNEHLLVAAEEAEASAEEVETLNEEMQATSEELETLNEELQATVEELNTTNEELGARGQELERVAKEREAELAQSEQQRRLFEAALEKAPFLWVLVERDGTITKVSELYMQRFAGNNGMLPSVGDQWKTIPQSITLETDGRTSLDVNVVQLPIDAGTARLVILSG